MRGATGRARRDMNDFASSSRGMGPAASFGIMLVPLHPFAQYVRPNPVRVLRPVALADLAAHGQDFDRDHQRDDEDDDASQDDFFTNNAPCTD